MPLPPVVAEALERASIGPITVDITTIGRRSERLQRIEIWMITVGRRVIICGTPGPRDWIANLRADPHLTVHFEGESAVDVAARAIEVTDEAVRAEVWNHPAAAWYREQTTVAELIATAPMIEVHLEPPPE